jgi:RND superfamily putative drug exporter
VAVPAAVLALAALGAASYGLSRLDLALTPISGLGSGSSPHRAAADASRGFTPGMIAPTEVVLRAPRVAADEGRLTRFARALEREPEVGAVVGAGLVPVPQRYAPVLRTPSGDAVRWFVALRHDPYSAAGATDLGRLQHAMPRLLAGAGFRGTDVLYAGDTALARETISRVNHDLLWVGIAAALVNLVLLSLFLRALVAPVLLVATSAMAIAATFGITVFVFRHLLGQTDLTYFVPLAVGVLLLSFGTDYNLFVVGRIWQESERRPVAEAVRVALPRAGRAISIAGLALAGSFAMLALVPIAPFRELAFAISVGVILDTFLVRTLLVPSLLTTLGERSWWPGTRYEPAPQASRPAPAAGVAAATSAARRR